MSTVRPRLPRAWPLALLLSLLAACSTSSPDVVQRGDAQRMSSVQDATVLSVRPVTIDGTQSGAGGVTGAIAGGVAGASVGGRREGIVVGVLAAVVGAVIGNTVERFSTRETAVELILQFPNGERRSLVQAGGNETFAAGDKVVVVTTAGKSRASRAPVVTN